MRYKLGKSYLILYLTISFISGGSHKLLIIGYITVRKCPSLANMKLHFYFL